MANRFAVASGNFNATSTWATTAAGSPGASVPVAGDNAIANNRTVAITADATCDNVTNGATYGGTAGGSFTLSNGVTLTANVVAGSAALAVVTLTGAASATIVGNITAGTGASSQGVVSSSTGTLTISGNNITAGSGADAFGVWVSSGNLAATLSGSVIGGTGGNSSFPTHGIRFTGVGSHSVTANVIAGTGALSHGIHNTSTASIAIIGSITGSSVSGIAGVNNAGAGTLNCTGSVSAGVGGPGINNATTGQLTITGNLTATNSAHAVACTNQTGANVVLSGSLISSASGLAATNCAKFLMNPTPSTAFVRFAKNGTTTFSNFYTADNTGLGPAVGDVRAGVVYGSATGVLAVPPANSVAFGVAVDNTTGTAVLTPEAVWGAATRTLTSASGPTAADNATAVWAAASRTITGGTVDTLTNAPSVPSASAIASQVRTELSVELGRVDQNISSRLAAADYVAPSAAPTVTAIRQEMDSNSTKLANLDATVSSRLASSAYSAAPTTAQIATAVEGSLLNEADGQAVLNALVSAIGNTNLSEVSLVAAVRADLERNGGKLDSIPTTSAPSASAVAGAVRTELGVELGRLDASVSSRLAPSGTLATVTNLTNAPASVTPSDIWSHSSRTLTSASGPTAAEIRQEMDSSSSKLANLDAAISSRMAASESTKIDAVKAKTDALNTERLGNVATTNIVGTLLAQANS